MSETQVFIAFGNIIIVLRWTSPCYTMRAHIDHSVERPSNRGECGLARVVFQHIEGRSSKCNVLGSCSGVISAAQDRGRGLPIVYSTQEMSKLCEVGKNKLTDRTD